ncbi:MAG: hypothetical protein K8S54_02825 [Spirochaetia bacterium]|nr:hypothetical protein [Spirochaetia bacterium]
MIQHFRFLIAFLVLIIATNLQAEMNRAFEAAIPLDQLRGKLTGVLDKIDREGYEMEPESQGFAYAYYNLRTSPFTYRMYATTVSEKQPVPILRVEGRSGDVLTFSRILQIEGIVRAESPVMPNGETIAFGPLEHKSHILGQSLNLVAPWLGVLHSSYGSPRLTTGQTVFRFSMYFGADALLVWAGGTNWFRNRWNPGRYGGNIAAALAIPRIVGAVQSANLVRGHNRLVELKYTFPVH